MNESVERASRVLLVDDAADDLEMYSSYLAHKGYEVTVAMDGQGAVDLALKDPFDVAVIDIGLPKLDGLGVIMVLRNYRKTMRLPMITLSAKTGEAMRAAAIDAGANLAMEKPCPPEELEQTIDVFIKRRR
jgi:two-component system response regulator CpxR